MSVSNLRECIHITYNTFDIIILSWIRWLSCLEYVRMSIHSEYMYNRIQIMIGFRQFSCFLFRIFNFKCSIQYTRLKIFLCKCYIFFNLIIILTWIFLSSIKPFIPYLNFATLTRRKATLLSFHSDTCHITYTYTYKFNENRVMSLIGWSIMLFTHREARPGKIWKLSSHPMKIE